MRESRVQYALEAINERLAEIERHLATLADSDAARTAREEQADHEEWRRKRRMRELDARWTHQKQE